MKKLFTLLTMLVLGIGSMWATDGSVTITSSSAAWVANGTFSNTSGTNAGSWRSTNGIISVLCLNGQAAILNYETKSRLANGNSFLIVANGDNHITGFSIKFKAYNEDGTARNSYITFHDGVQVNSNSSAEVTKSFSGLNAQVIKFTTGNNWVDIIDFSVSYAEGSDNTLRSTTPINTFNSEAFAGWLKVQTPSDYIFYTMSSLRMNLRTNSYNYDVYLVVSDHQVGSGTTSGLSESDFTAISSNSSGTSSTDVTFNFTNPVTLRGGSIYYLYFATKSNNTYTLSQRGIKVQTGSNSLGVGANVTDTGIFSSSNTWSIPFIATLTPVTSNLKCRLKAKWPNTSTSAQHYTNYVFAKTDNLDKLYKNNKTELSAADMINAKMVWNVTYSGSGLKLQNVGTERYISKFTSNKANGDAINLLTAINSTNAETLKIQEYNTQGQGYIALVSGNQLSENNRISFLESFSSSNDYVGCHNNYDAGDAFIFERVKTVTFVDGEGEAFNVAVNGGDAVSAIYVACDGSSASTLSLPSDNLYSLDSGETWLSNTDAAEIISAAGTSNISVIVVPAVSVTYNLIWDDPSTPIKTKASVNAPQGFSPSVTVPWNAPAFCDFSYDVSTIESTTTEVNVTIDWNGPFEFSNSFNDATWYNLKINGDYLIYASTGNYNLVSNISSAESAGYNAFWGFIGNPVDGVQIINKSAGEGKSLAPYTPPSMAQGTFSWAVRQWGGNFSLDWSYNYLNNVDGVLKLYNSSTTSGDPTNLGCSVESASYRGVALDFIDEYANSHALGQYFGVSTESYNYLRNIYAKAESVSAEDYTSLESNISFNLSPKLPETGYYRIKSSGSRGGESYITYGYLDGSKGTGLLTTIGNKETDLGTVVKLTRVGTSKNYKISIQGLNVQAHSGDNTLFKATDATAVNFAFNHINFSGMCSIYDGTNHGNMHEADWKKQDTGLNGVVGWDAGDGTNASSWSVEDATACTVTLNSDGATTPTYYATLCVPFDVTISDATAYTLAKSESGNYLVPTEVTDNKVPAGTPVLLKGTNATATATINTGSAFGSPLDCALTGIYVTTSVNAKTNYVFGKFNGKVGFYHVDNEEFSLKANRAYLQASVSGARGFSLMFDDDVTGIVSTPGETEEGTTIYNLSGQRLNKIQKGINIVNGKKVLF